MTNWKEYKLGEIAKVKGGKRLPKGSSLTPIPNKHPYIRVRDMGNKYLPITNLEYVPINVFPSIKNYIVDKNDVILSIVGSVGLVSIVNDNLDKASLTENCVKILPNKDILNNEFLYYFLSSSLGQNEINKKIVGAVQPKLPIYNINDIVLNLPDLPTQTAIEEILSSLDDKIELNNKINQELENLAQTLFKQWFIDFEFPNENGEPYKSSGGEMVDSELGEIPMGWKTGTLNDILEVKGGTTPSTKNPLFWDGEFHWTSPRDLSNLQFPLLLNTAKKITKEGLREISSGLLPKGTLLLSSRAPIGYLAITEIEIAINQGYIAINAKKGFSNKYILYWIKSNMELIIERANGSTFLEISKTNFKQINCLIPSSVILNEYENQIEIIFEHLRINLLENQVLINLRDTLLPKLISGEMEVNINNLKNHLPFR
jgi:type I restriction enzyme S subunit